MPWPPPDMPPERYQLTLAQALEKHGLYSQPFGGTAAVQVFYDPAIHAQGWDFHHLKDYIVSSAVSGPSFILVPATPTPNP